MSDYEAGQERGYADGRASRDAEVAALEARVVELEAVIQKVRQIHQARRVQTGSSTHGGQPQYGEVCTCGTFGCNLFRTLALAPSVVLADHDAAVWDEGFIAAREWAAGGRDRLSNNPYRGDNR